MPNFSHHHENSKTIVNEEERKKVEKIQLNKKSENIKLDNLFNELKILNEQSVGKLENMIALTMISELRYDEAIPYLTTAAQNGYQKAQYNLGLCYQDGLGVDKDEKIVNFTFYYLLVFLKIFFFK
jgi:TPR repeat protein